MGKMILNGKEYVGGENWHKYSTSERIVGEWIDGKPLYEKVVTFTNLPAGTTSFYVNPNVQNISKVIDARCVVDHKDGTFHYLPFPLDVRGDLSLSRNYAMTFHGYEGNNGFRIETGTGVGTSDGWIIFQYTKTTD